jgi:hypothetical protein
MGRSHGLQTEKPWGDCCLTHGFRHPFEEKPKRVGLFGTTTSLDVFRFDG